jgi:jasmonate O-methyltransferase
VLLNDLPDNDFSSVAKRLVAFQEDAASFGPVFTAIVPGSFYKRPFISSSLHLVLASNSVHWLSEVTTLIGLSCPVHSLHLFL